MAGGVNLTDAAGDALCLPQRQCSAPYRAPELWDVPSSCTLGESDDGGGGISFDASLQ